MTFRGARAWVLWAVVLNTLACVTAAEPDPADTATPDSGEASAASSIVNGRRTPTAVRLDAASIRSIGAVMLGSARDGWFNVCTGTLVADRVVLTAAHCVVDEDGLTLSADQLAFASGEDAAQPEAFSTVQRVAVHPDYVHAGLSAEGDAAILILEQGIASARALPVQCGALARNAVVGRTMQAVGFGDTSSHGSNNTRRYWATERVVDMGRVDLTVDGGGRQGVCTGDSGGPALMTVDGVVRIVGVLSWGDAECGNVDHYALASSVCPFVTPFLQAGTPHAVPGEAQTVEGVTFTAAEAAAVLALANTATLTELDDAVGLDRRAAQGIVDARPLGSLQQLAAVTYVGTTALARLKDHAR